jgi:hypothetical protein
MSFDLADVRSIKLVDEGTRRDVSEFANATASARRRDAKTIVVTSDGAGSREMLVSYTVAAPIWKTTYRVVLDSSGKPFFQGWAIVDNVSDEDWTNISLSLVSGSPVSFIQPIQKPFYRYRPIVPMPDDLKLNPQTYEPGEGGAVGGGAMNIRKDGANETVTVTNNGLGFAQRSVQTLPSNDRAMRNLQALSPATSNNYAFSGAAANVTSLSDAITRPDSGVEAAATGAEVGDLFEYKIDQPVTVPRDRSALIPILQTRMEGERVSIYNEGTRRDRAMGGMLLKNTSPLTLEGGAMTVNRWRRICRRSFDGTPQARRTAIDFVCARPRHAGQFHFEGRSRAHIHGARSQWRVPGALLSDAAQGLYAGESDGQAARDVLSNIQVKQDWTLSDDTGQARHQDRAVLPFPRAARAAPEDRPAGHRTPRADGHVTR